MEYYEVADGDTLYFKDLGAQISWTTVFIVEYFGPMAIFVILAYCPTCIYGEAAKGQTLTFTQKAGFWMVIGHYLKREYETMFIHRFGNNTMPFNRIFINSAHYWGVFGALVGYFFLHPKFTEPEYLSKNMKWGLILAFVIFQFMNFMAHYTLRNLRRPGTNERNIPRGWGFDQVSCANYFYETMAWLTFSIFSGTATSYVFLLFSFYQMRQWASDKHKRYVEEFPDYPKDRKMIIPFLH